MAEEGLLRRDRVLDHASRIGSFLLLAIAIGAIADITFDYSKNFVHPTYLDSILPRSISTGLSAHWDDLLISIGQFGPEESRPRFLALLIEVFDVKLRLFLYDYTLLPPTVLPISWLLQAVIAPLFLFPLVRNLGGDRIASTVAVAVYMSSIGFLSGFSMAFISGKALVTVSMIIAMYLLSSIQKVNANRKFSDAHPATIVAALLTVFLGLFLDEVGTFAFVLLPIMFWPLFWDNLVSSISQKPDWKGIALCAIPAVVFLFIVVVVIPDIYKQNFGQSFDYLGNVFAVGIGSLGAKSIFEGPHGTFGWPIIWLNLKNFFGITLVPLQISPFTNQNTQDIGLIQTSNIPQFLGLGALFGILIVCAAARSKPAVWLRRTLITTAVFVVLMTLLSIRHNPIIIGYYYGASISLFIALLVGLAVAVVSRKGQPWQLAGVVVALLIVVVQVNNYMFVNYRWRVLHYEHVVRPAHEKEFRLAPPGTELTSDEFIAIRSAWKEGKLASYLNDHEISVEAIYLVLELRTIDRLRPRSAN